MSTIQVWSSVEKLASEWAKSPLVEQLTANLPVNNLADSGVPEALRNLDAGTDIVSTQPLLTAMWEPLAEGLPLVHLDREVSQFLRSVAPIGHALEVSVGWIRSRLPRYPLIPAPQLAVRGYRRCEEYGARLPWRGQVLQAGLQFEPTPPKGMSALLLLPTSEEINAATVALAAALAETEEWREFDRLSGELTDDDRLTLRQAVQRINELLAPDKVHEFEPERMARRERFRIDQVETVVQALAGRPKEFADSFWRVDDLIDLVAIDVLGQVATRGAPIQLDTVENLEIDGANVRFVNSSDTYLPAGSLARLPDPLVPEVIIVDSWAITSNPATGGVISHRARRLTGTETAFTTQ